MECRKPPASTSPMVLPMPQHRPLVRVSGQRPHRRFKQTLSHPVTFLIFELEEHCLQDIYPDKLFFYHSIIFFQNGTIFILISLLLTLYMLLINQIQTLLKFSKWNMKVPHDSTYTDNIVTDFCISS